MHRLGLSAPQDGWPSRYNSPLGGSQDKLDSQILGVGYSRQAIFRFMHWIRREVRVKDLHLRGMRTLLLCADKRTCSYDCTTDSSARVSIRQTIALHHRKSIASNEAVYVLSSSVDPSLRYQASKALSFRACSGNTDSCLQFVTVQPRSTSLESLLLSFCLSRRWTS